MRKMDTVLELLRYGFPKGLPWEDKISYVENICDEGFTEIQIDGVNGRRYSGVDDIFEFEIEIFEHDVFFCDYANITVKRLEIAE